MIRSYLQKIYENASQIRVNKMLDAGCNDGSWTKKVAIACHANEILGIELNERQADKARQLGIKTIVQDLSKEWQCADSSFDLVHANQVIEHVPDLDHFAKEIFRVLSPNGTIIVSTENGSSWHNIFASIMGWQIFSLTNVSNLSNGIGNPLALHRGNNSALIGWTHKTIFNYLGLKEFFEHHGFIDVRIAGAGYHPLPAILGQWDPRHAHFLTLTAKKN